jgi:hypothetical protein
VVAIADRRRTRSRGHDYADADRRTLQRLPKRPNRPERPVGSSGNSAAPLNFAPPKLTGIPTIIGAPSIVTHDTRDAVMALFASDILPVPERVEHENLEHIIKHSLLAFNNRWSAIPYTLTFLLQERTRGRALVATFESPEHVAIIDAEPLDQSLCAYNRKLARAMFDEIERCCSFGTHLVMPKDIYGIAEFMWFNGSADEFYANIDDWSEIEIDETNRGMHIRKFLRENERLTPGALRNAIGRHYFRAPKLTKRERRQLIANAPKALRRTLTTIEDACASLSSLPNPKKLKLHDALGLGDPLDEHSPMPRPSIVFDTSRPWPNVYRNFVNELIDDMDNQVLEMGEDYCPVLAFTIDETPASLDKLRTTLVALDRTWTALRTISNAIDEFGQAISRSSK